MNYWLVKSEPGNYSIDDLMRDGKTSWDGVRNYQARNNLMKMQVGDLVLVYHSVSNPGVVGLASVIKTHYIDPTDKTAIFSAVDLKFERKFKTVYSLKEIKQNPELCDLALVKQGRLSVMPVNEKQWQQIMSNVQG
jgi:predicted RNA-binding protein with PUA-like domain